MLRIRLARGGKKRQPSYRIVVTEITSPRDGRFVEQIGFYNPMTNPDTYKVKEDRALYWLSVGAQPSDAVARLLKTQGTTERLRRLHAGEPLEKLVAEYEGRPWPTPVAETPAPSLAARAVAAAEEVVAAVAEAVETVAETAAEAVETAAEAVSEIVEQIAGNTTATDETEPAA